MFGCSWLSLFVLIIFCVCSQKVLDVLVWSLEFLDVFRCPLNVLSILRFLRLFPAGVGSNKSNWDVGFA